MLIIRRITTPEELHLVGVLRYEVYVEEMRFRQTHADHEKRTVIEPLDTEGRVLAAFDPATGQAVGTIRINIGSDGSFGFYDDLLQLRRFGPFYPQALSVTTKLSRVTQVF